MSTTRWLLVGLVCLALWPAPAVAQAEPWKDYNKAGVEAFLDGDYAEARRQFAASLGAARRFGPDDPRLAPGLNGLAEVYRAQGEYDNAARLHRQALAIREKALGPEHSEVAQSLSNLARTYRAQGDVAAAEPLQERVRAIQDRIAAEAASWRSDMAAAKAAYRKGDHAEAEKHVLAAVARAEGFGPPGPRLARSLNNLAEIYRVGERYAEAESTHRRALAILEKTLGPEDRQVATSLNNLALLYHAQRRHREAEPLYRRSLVILEKAVGPTHPEVARGLENYAVLLRDTGRLSEASRMAAQATAIRAELAKEKPAN